MAFWAVSFVSSFSAFCPQVPSSLSQPSCSQSLHPPACIDARGCPDPDAGPCTCICGTSWGSHGPTSQACLGSSRWHPIPQACQLQRSAYALDVTIQPISHPPRSPSIKYISLQFREKDIVEDHVKGFTEVHLDDICSSSLVSRCSYSIIEGH